MGLGYVKRKDGSTVKIDDYRYRANGNFIEVKEAYSHKTISIPSSDISEIKENWFGTPSWDAKFKDGRRSEIDK